MSRLRFAAAIVAALGFSLIIALVLFAGDETPEDADPVGQLRVGSAAPLADCSAWKAGTVEEKQATIESLRQAVSPTRSSEPVMSDDLAFEILESQCAPEYADGFRLYKLYARAAPFAQLQP